MGTHPLSEASNAKAGLCAPCFDLESRELLPPEGSYLPSLIDDRYRFFSLKWDFVVGPDFAVSSPDRRLMTEATYQERLPGVSLFVFFPPGCWVQ